MMNRVELYTILNLLTESREKIYLSINMLGQRRTFTDYDDYDTITEDSTYILMHVLYKCLRHFDNKWGSELEWLLFESFQYSQDDVFRYSLLNEDKKFFWHIVRRYAKNILKNDHNVELYQKFDFIDLIERFGISCKNIAADAPSQDYIEGMPPLSSLANAVLIFSILRKVGYEEDSPYLWGELKERLSSYNEKIIDIYGWLKWKSKGVKINPVLRFLSLKEIEFLLKTLKPFNTENFNFYPFLIQGESILIGEFVLGGSIYNKNVIMYNSVTEKFCVISTNLSEYVINLLRFWLVKYPTLESLDVKMENIEIKLSKIDIPVENLFLKK